MTSSWPRSPPSLLALLLPACISTPSEVNTTGDVASTSGATVGTGTTHELPVTTTQGDATEGTQGGSGLDTATTVSSTSSDETTAGVGPTTGDGDTSSSGGSSSGGPPPECMIDDECPNNEICDGGACVDACSGSWGMGSYGYCLSDYGGFDTTAQCGAGNLCIYWGNPIGQTACSTQSCTTACDCPAPPATGNAIVTCGQLTEAMTPNDCYLDCSNGETCPDGTTCNGGGVCVTDVPPQPVYGNCNLAPDCAAPGFCAVGAGGEEVCMESCGDAGDCPPAPPGGTAVVGCNTVAMGNPGPECYLDCSGGLLCPPGMTCYGGAICLWP